MVWLSQNLFCRAERKITSFPKNQSHFVMIIFFAQIDKLYITIFILLPVNLHNTAEEHFLNMQSAPIRMEMRS